MKSAEDQGQTAGDRVGTTWPGVSVVIPVLNEERHLEAAIRRVLDQDYPGELEVIIAVGPSSDRTHEIAKALAAADPRIRVVDNPAARTPAALNLGIAAAMGLVHRAMPDGELEGFIDETVKTLSENAPLSIANSKTIIEEFVKASGEPDHVRMKASIERCRNSSDLQEGRRAFAEKRKPNFSGS